MSNKRRESWGSRVGVIMAVAGSSVGLGNFLRFPGLAAQYGGGAFMVAYVIAFLIVGLPLGWAEWTMGRFSGQAGYNSCPATFGFITRSRLGIVLGVIGVVIPAVVCMYYLVIEAWCLGYAVNFFRGGITLTNPEEAKVLFSHFIGNAANGTTMQWSWNSALPWFVIVFFLNIWIIVRGLRGGIERVCNIGIPLLTALALIVLVRVLTLGAPDVGHPQNNIWNGLGYLWNPSKVQVIDRENHIQEVVGEQAIAEAQTTVAASHGSLRLRVISPWMQLRNPRLWLAAAGQALFSLAIGFGIIIVYASYLRKNDDVVLSGLTSSTFSGICEIVFGGLITVPSAVAFLGVASVVGQAGIGLGFRVLPMVFERMPLGHFFGGVFFCMLFIAAITSSISMLQPGLVFLQESLNFTRRWCIVLLSTIVGGGSLFVLYYSADMKALDTLDFWGGTLLMFVLATIQVVIFGWVWGIEKGTYEMHRGAGIRTPDFFDFVLKWLSPLFLGTIFVLWILQDVFDFDFGSDQFPTIHGREVGRNSGSGEFTHWANFDPPYITDLFGSHANPVARMSVAIILGLGLLFTVLALRSSTMNRAKKGLPRHPESPKP